MYICKYKMNMCVLIYVCTCVWVRTYIYIVVHIFSCIIKYINNLTMNALQKPTDPVLTTDKHIDKTAAGSFYSRSRKNNILSIRNAGARLCVDHLFRTAGYVWRRCLLTTGQNSEILLIALMQISTVYESVLDESLWIIQIKDLKFNLIKIVLADGKSICIIIVVIMRIRILIKKK